MRKIAEALRLRASGLSTRKIAASLSIGQSTVSEYLKRADHAGLSWPLPGDLNDADLDARLFRAQGGVIRRGLSMPDWPKIHSELKRNKSVTLSLLWEEYKAAHPTDGYGYSRFCELYRRWEGRLTPTMRQHHFAGERVFIDYAGDAVPVIDPITDEVREAEVFVGVLGASSYTYAEATWTQALPDWISSHVRMFDFFGGVPGLLVSDNLKSGVTTANRYEPTLNRTYADLAAHYDTAIIPARAGMTKDKTKSRSGWSDLAMLGRGPIAQTPVPFPGRTERGNPGRTDQVDKQGHPASRCQPLGAVRAPGQARPEASFGAIA